MKVLKKYDLEIGGKTMSAIFTDLADQANGSVVMKYGDTEVLVTAVMGKKDKEGQDFFPLSVEFEERFYAAGAILGSRFRRREGMPSEEAILSARIVDRTIRPLFDHRLRRDVQIIVTVLSIANEDPDVLGVIGASLALATSNIPWQGPVSAVRIGKVKGEDGFIINPDYSERVSEKEELDLLACGKDGNINMIEIGAKEYTNEQVMEALKEAVSAHNKLQEWQNQIIKEMAQPKEEITFKEAPEQLNELFEKEIEPKMLEYVFANNDAYGLREVWLELVKEQLGEEHVSDALYLFEEKIDKFVHDQAIYHNRRQDGRDQDEIREIYAEAGSSSNVVHGVGIFYRGGTHVMSTTTLGGPEDALIIDSIEQRDFAKRFMHHYNFPPFSVGETGRVTFNRRAIGHGALVEKALNPVIPPQSEFPYTIRVVSETMASNGSSSQASVCASTLSLMDAGVPIKAPVAGIAMGLMADEELIGKNTWDADKYKILTDIQGPEDHFGDMDFKVAGTKDGITAVQMDVKLDGVPLHVLEQAFQKAESARMFILDKMAEAIDKPRAQLKPTVPRIETLQVKPDQIGLVIGAGGKTVNEIKDTSGVDAITIEEDGTVFITGKGDSVEKAKQMIEELTKEYAVGDRLEGTVSKITDFGAIVKFGNKDGLVHISELAPFRVDSVSGVLSVGEKIPVIIKNIDERNRFSLSLKDADPNYIKNKNEQSAKQSDTQKPEQS